ncbi:MAG: SLBB domain-containing protein [Parachlamydia sp.]|jgi:hypothetical protein|nr:SLBB domain-containing protein [Parachlamydia sp.]
MVKGQPLPLHEWLIVALLILAFGLLTITTLIQNHRIPSTTQMIDISFDLVEVTVQGAVEKPGVYELNKGRKIKDLWLLCGPLPEADLKGFKPNSYLRDGQTLKVPAKEMITIYLKGAVSKETSLQVEKGTRLYELKDKIEFLPQADFEKMKNSRRLLKDQELIFVIFQKAKKPII